MNSHAGTEEQLTGSEAFALLLHTMHVSEVRTPPMHLHEALRRTSEVYPALLRPFGFKPPLGTSPELDDAISQLTRVGIISWRDGTFRFDTDVLDYTMRAYTLPQLKPEEREEWHAAAKRFSEELAR